nr:MAG TPA: hypothetical protein [Bacteriophage sp.]
MQSKRRIWQPVPLHACLCQSTTPPQYERIEHNNYNNIKIPTCLVTKPMIYYRHTYITYISITII